MSRQIGSLHLSNCHPANLQTQIPIIPLFAFLPPDSSQINIPSSMNSDTNSDISVFHTISQFNNSDVETPDEFADSEPSPSTYTHTSPSAFSKPTFRPIQPHHEFPSPSTPSHVSQITPTYSRFNSERSNNNSPDNIEISEELDNFYSTPTTAIISPHSQHSLIIINSIIIKSTNTYTTFRLYPIISSTIHINRNIHKP